MLQYLNVKLSIIKSRILHSVVNLAKLKPHILSGKNFLTNPTKKGSGYGYNSLTIGHDLQYSGESISLPDEIRAAERKVGANRILRSFRQKLINIKIRLGYFSYLLEIFKFDVLFRDKHDVSRTRTGFLCCRETFSLSLQNFKRFSLL